MICKLLTPFVCNPSQHVCMTFPVIEGPVLYSGQGAGISGQHSAHARSRNTNGVPLSALSHRVKVPISIYFDKRGTTVSSADSFKLFSRVEGWMDDLEAYEKVAPNFPAFTPMCMAI